jgi:RNA polymerase sigma-70 factor (ECF subfamily)
MWNSTHPDELAARIAAGDEAAFEQVFHAYRDRLCRYFAAYVKSWTIAEDLVGELFLTLWRQREKLGAVRDLNAYLYSTARFDALDYLRHARLEQRWQAQQSGPAMMPEHQVLPSVERGLMADEVTAAVLRAMDDLSDRQREVLRRRMESQSHQDIAAALGISVKTVEVHVTRAIAQLRKMLPQFLE